MASPNPLAATVEDYDSDTEVTVYTSIKPPKPARAQPKAQSTSPTGPLIPDAASDSGYSSRTAATLGSADSTEKPAGSSTAVQSDFLPNTRKPCPATTANKARDAQPSAEPSTSRPSSRSTRPERPTMRRCSEPNCPQCAASSHSYRKSPLESPWNLSYPPFAPQPAQSPYPPPSPIPSPQPFPQYSHYHTNTTAAPTVLAPQPRRRSTSQSRQPRPGSYHPSATADGYWVPVNNPPRHEPGPPPAPSAYSNTPYHHHSYFNYQQPPSPTMAYHSAGLIQGPPPGPSYTSARPALTHRATENPSRRARPISMHEAIPQTSYDPSFNPNALVRRPSSRPRSSNNQHESYVNNGVDRHRMPPPPLPPGPRAPARQHPEPSRYSSDYYEYSESSDSSGSSQRASTLTQRPQSRVSGRPAYTTSYHNSQQPSREQSENNRGRSHSFAAREQRRDSQRHGSFTDANPTETKEESRPRRTRPTSRPARDPEDQNPATKAGMMDGFRIEVQPQGMDINVNGQRFSVMPKEGGVAELIFGPKQEDKTKRLNGGALRSQSSTSNPRTGRSSKSPSEVGAVPPASLRKGSANAQNPS